MWLLVFISYMNGSIAAIGNGLFENHLECFAAREALSGEVGGQLGHFPKDLQAICMRVSPPK